MKSAGACGFDQLYRDNVGLIRMWRNRYAPMCNATCDRDDLMQAGFLGLVRAAATWEPDRGSWSAWASFYIRNAMKHALGLRSKHVPTVSLDAPLFGDEGASTLMELIADENAPSVPEAAEHAAIRAAVREAVAAIGDDRSRGAVECIYLRGMSRSATSDRLGIPASNLGNLLHKGLAALAKDRKLRAAILDDETLFCTYKGVKAFMRDLTSTTEAAVIWRENYGR